MLFVKSALLFFSFQDLGGVADGQVPPDWFSQIQQDFSNSSFPLRRCFKRDNVAPTSGTRCGPKPKTCFFGDQNCGSGEGSPYPTESCTCNGTSSNDLGTWICQSEECPTEECQDPVLRERQWFDYFFNGCDLYAIDGRCEIFGNDPERSNFNLTATSACCACGGGVVDSSTLTCSDVSVVFDPPEIWTDTGGDNCSWYAEKPQTRCVDFEFEYDSLFDLTLGEGCCCACADVVPPTNPTCTDLPGWTFEGSSCIDISKAGCSFFGESEDFGYTIAEACCKCELRGTDPNAPRDFDPPTEPFTAGGCTPDSSKFDICVKVAPNVAPEVVDVIRTARQTWSAVIVEDSPEFQYDFDTLNDTTGFYQIFAGGLSPDPPPTNATGLPAFYKAVCGYDPGFPSGDTTDDLNVCVNQRFLPVKDNFLVLAEAGAVFGDRFTRFGYITINSLSIRELRENITDLEGILVHELGHILGIGFQWAVNSTDCSYIGENANRVYQEISGCPSSVTMPIEKPTTYEFDNCDGTTSTTIECGGHLRESCFMSELMTPTKSEFASPLSALTIAVIEDLGYTVDYSQADASFTRADLNASCVCDNSVSNTTNAILKRRLEEQPQQSDEGQTKAIKYAKKELKEMNKKAMTSMMNGPNADRRGVNIPGMSIVYLDEDGTIRSVYVSNDGEGGGDDDEDDEAYTGPRKEQGDVSILRQSWRTPKVPSERN